jgi:hypothetical protein
MTMCGHGHEMRGPQDRLTNGSCRHCHRIYLRRSSKRRTEAAQIVKAAEARGLTATEALEIFADAPIEVLRMLSRADPVAMARVQRLIEELSKP